MLKRVGWLLVGFPAAAVLIALAIANRHTVILNLDPFRPENPVVSLSLPFFAYLFGALIVGVLLGGLSTWISQARWRRAARTRAAETRRWQGEADRLAREREAEVASRARALAAPDRRNAA